MNKITNSLLILAVGGLLLGSAAAQTSGAPASEPAGPGVVDPGHPRVNQVDNRLQDQKERIKQGVKDGTITKQQARQLGENDKRIEQREKQDMAKNGGHLTKQEQANINKAMNKNSNKIYKEKHGH